MKRSLALCGIVDVDVGVKEIKFSHFLFHLDGGFACEVIDGPIVFGEFPGWVKNASYEGKESVSSKIEGR